MEGGEGCKEKHKEEERNMPTHDPDLGVIKQGS